MAKSGETKFTTVSVRGIGFAPKKTEHLVLPEAVQNEADLVKFLEEEPLPVADIAIEGLKQNM